MSDEAAEREAIRQLITRSGRDIDNNQFDAYIGAYAPGATYTLEAESLEIGKPMKWLELGINDLQGLLEESPNHVHDLAARTHMVTVDEISLDGDCAEALSSFAVFRTDQAGASEVYAVGHYTDKLIKDGNDWRITERRAHSKTRLFRTPTPMPL